MKKSTTDDFFDFQTEKSYIKTIIVTEFFKVYFSIINNANISDKIYYIDLFAGPGVYKDKTPSTPILLLDSIASFEKDDIRDKLQMVFNDENGDFYLSLKTQVESHPVYGKLKYTPIISNKKAREVDLSEILSENKPKFSFIDPWGYIDVSAKQIGELVKSIGLDCILFFNTNRILQDLSKDQSIEHMKKIFGEELPKVLSVQKDTSLSQQQKSHYFVSAFSENLYKTYFLSLKNKGYRLFVLPFSISQDDVDKISHYILFISKNHKAIIEMKKIMLKRSTMDDTSLGFDQKDKYVISLFSRKDDIEIEIRKVLLQMLSVAPKMYEYYCTPAEWLQYIDSFYMREKYEVSPYTVDDLKRCFEEWDKMGYIEIEMPSAKIRSRITLSRKIRFSKTFRS